MRGKRSGQTSMLMLGSPESVVPKAHPIRRVKALADEVLADMSPTFDAMYAAGGRRSVPPSRIAAPPMCMGTAAVS